MKAVEEKLPSGLLSFGWVHLYSSEEAILVGKSLATYNQVDLVWESGLQWNQRGCTYEA